MDGQPVLGVPAHGPKLILVLNSGWNVLNFRAGLVRGLQQAGCEVVVATPDDGWAEPIRQIGCRWLHLPMQAHGTNPWADVQLWRNCRKLLQQEKPDAVLSYTIKPNVYMPLGAWGLGVPVICNIAGLGALFINQSLATRVARSLYRAALARAAWVFFQNPDDQAQFIDEGLVPGAKTSVLPGSGIDGERFKPDMGRLRTTSRYPAVGAAPGSASESDQRPFTFLMVARLLWDKGVGELVEAARLLRAQGLHFQVQLLGAADSGNPAGISEATVQQWQAQGLVCHLGHVADTRPYLEAADCIVLPSYREGTPRSLLEAAAMAKPIIATDVPGCREVVRHQENGLLCQARNPQDLADQMARMISLAPAERARMGATGRERVLREFDERIVIDHYRKAIERCTGRTMGGRCGEP